MAYNIFLVQLNETDAFTPFRDTECLYQSPMFVRREGRSVSYLPSQFLSIHPHAGKEHFDLLCSGILRFIQDHDCVIQRASAPRLTEQSVLMFSLHVFPLTWRRVSYLQEASYNGCRYGSILSFMSPGEENRVFRRLLRQGRLRMIFFLDFLILQCAYGLGNGGICVFPEPAGPSGNTISFLAKPSTSFQLVLLAPRGMIGFSVTLNTITFPFLFLLAGHSPLMMSMITSSF